jgi:hypothetical protein
LIVLAFVGIVLFDVLESWDSGKPPRKGVTELEEILGMGVVGLLILKISRRSLIRGSVRRMLRHPDNVRMLGKLRVRISADGLSAMDEFGATTQRPWITIVRIESTDNHAFAFFTENTAYVIPRRAFATEGEFRTFVETAQQFHTQAGLQKFSEARPSTAPEQVGQKKSEHLQPGDSTSVTGEK